MNGAINSLTHTHTAREERVVKVWRGMDEEGGKLQHYSKEEAAKDEVMGYSPFSVL